MVQACQSWAGTTVREDVALDHFECRNRNKSDLFKYTNRDAAKEQGECSQQVDAKRCTVEDAYNIKLVWPNCVLIMATVQGGYARRGKFTAAFGNQIRKSDGLTSVEEMFTRASNSLTQDVDWKTSDQLPECRSTLRKILRL